MASSRDQSRREDAAQGFRAPPADGGLSIDKLAQAFAAMMGTADPYAAAPPPAPADVIDIDASPDLDDGGNAACRVNPMSILEALLFVGLPGGKPLSSRTVAGLMRGVRAQEVDEFAAELGRRCVEENRPYEVVARGDGWVMRLRPEFARFGHVLEGRVRRVRLDAESLDVLALVAWSQPVPRDRLVELGCDARPTTLRALVRRGLLRLVPATESAEACYETTPKFLEVFKLESLADLPAPTAPPD